MLQRVDKLELKLKDWRETFIVQYTVRIIHRDLGFKPKRVRWDAMLKKLTDANICHVRVNCLKQSLKKNTLPMMLALFGSRAEK